MEYNVSDVEFFKIIKGSTSIREAIIKCGLIPAGGNYKTINKRIKSHNLDTSHFKGHGWNKGISVGPKRPIEDYLSNNIEIQSLKLKKRLIKEKFFNHECCNCKLKDWINNPIPLELHHIDGDSYNNNLSNIKLLCPNCHALTDNYRGKNKKIKQTSIV